MRHIFGKYYYHDMKIYEDMSPVKVYCQWCDHLTDWNRCKAYKVYTESWNDVGYYEEYCVLHNENNDCSRFEKISWLRYKCRSKWTPAS